MIILTEDDRDSIHTLVPPPDSTANADVADISKPEAPCLLTTLSFLSLAASIPPFAFSLNHLNLSHEQAIPTIVTFVIGIPFYIGAAIILCNQTTFNWMPSKIWIVVYIILLQVLWAFSAIESGLVLYDVWGSTGLCIKSTQSTGRERQTSDLLLCITPRATLLISTILETLEVIILGAVVRIIAKWKILELPANNDEPLSPPKNPPLPALRFLGPLAYTSIGFSIPPLVTALLHISNPDMFLYSIPTITAFVLTSLLLTANLVLGRMKATFSLKDRCAKTPVFLLTLGAIWLFSTVLGVRKLSDSKIWAGMCLRILEDSSQCSMKLKGRFIVSIICTSIQALILTTMAIIYYARNRYTESITSALPPLSTPPQNVLKGPRVAF